MVYTLYAPQNVTVRTSDIGDIPMLLTLPKLARFVPAAVLGNPSVIANRSGTTPADAPVFVELRLAFDGYEVDDVEELEANVTTWAQRCRIAGVRGQRLAVVSEPTDADSNTIVFTVLIGTTVFYNDRRVTVGVSLIDDELREDLENLFPYVPVRPTVERIDIDGTVVQVLPKPTPVAAFSIDPALNLPTTFGGQHVDPTVTLEQAVLSLLRIGTEAAPLLVSRDQFDPQSLRDRLDNLLLELSAVRAQMK